MVAVAYFDGYPESVTPGQMMPPPAIGLLRFDVTPRSAQVFVDSFYAGTIADIEAQRVLTLAAGPHRIELRAAGYQPVTFDVRIDPNDTIVYRAALERERTAATAAARPTGPTRHLRDSRMLRGQHGAACRSTALRMRHQAGARHRPAA